MSRRRPTYEELMDEEAVQLLLKGETTTGIAERLGIPQSTVARRRKQCAYVGIELPGGRKASTRPAHPEGRPKRQSAKMDDEVEYYRARLDELLWKAEQARKNGQYGHEIRFEDLAGKARKDLAAALRETEAERALAKQGQLTDPNEVANRAISVMPLVVRLCDLDKAHKLIKVLQAELARREP